MLRDEVTATYLRWDEKNRRAEARPSDEEAGTPNHERLMYEWYGWKPAR